MALPDITTLIAGLQVEDPKLYQALMLINGRMQDLEAELFPLTRQAEVIAVIEATVSAPLEFDSLFTPTTVRFYWPPSAGAAQYEIRRGSSWEIADLQLRTSSLQADIDPLLVGTYKFLIKAISSSGAYSSSTNQCTVTVPPLGFVSITKQIIDNNVLLSWTAPSSVFKIDHYKVYKDAVLVGTLSSTFFVRFEAIGGTYSYNIVAVDVAGNISADSTVEVIVTSPPDYVLQEVTTSAFGGTKTNTRLIDGFLYATINTETWQEHFQSRAWSNPQNQKDAGYPIYIQPTANTGSYVEVIDYGSVLNNNIVTVGYQQEVIVDGMTITISTRTSTDGVSWTSPETGPSVFVATMRYLELTLSFAPTT